VAFGARRNYQIKKRGMAAMVSLVLTKESYERICVQALAEYQQGECCGILTIGAEGGASQVHSCENIQNKMHAEDPEEFPRTTLNAYLIDAGEQYRILSGAEKAGGGVSGFYHSHVDCPAYFSDEDKARALFGDEPAYPEAAYLVIAVYGPRSEPKRDEPVVEGYKGFAWDEGRQDYVEVAVDLLG
jgi:proteasome lid subunit RPN8/RPN11